MALTAIALGMALAPSVATTPRLQLGPIEPGAILVLGIPNRLKSGPELSLAAGVETSPSWLIRADANLALDAVYQDYGSLGGGLSALHRWHPKAGLAPFAGAGLAVRLVGVDGEDTSGPHPCAPDYYPSDCSDYRYSVSSVHLSPEVSAGVDFRVSKHVGLEISGSADTDAVHHIVLEALRLRGAIFWPFRL